MASASAPRTVGALVDAVEGRLVRGDPQMVVDRLADPETAGPRDVIVAFRGRRSTPALARDVALLIAGTERADTPELRQSPARAVALVAAPRLALARLSRLWAPARPGPGRHPSAVIDPSAVVHPAVHVGPFVVIGARAVVEAGAVLGPGAHVGEGARIGADAWLRDHAVVRDGCVVGARCVLHPGAIVGADGFGFATSGPTQHERIEQLGNVVLEDDVELGANACVDRATLGTTRVGRGTKIDNLVQVGHNVDIGPGVLLIAQSGIAGSSRVQAGAIIAAQAGVAGHVTVGAGARVLGQAGVRANVPDGQEVAGTPAEPKLQHFRRVLARRSRKERNLE